MAYDFPALPRTAAVSPAVQQDPDLEGRGVLEGHWSASRQWSARGSTSEACAELPMSDKSYPASRLQTLPRTAMSSSCSQRWRRAPAGGGLMARDRASTRMPGSESRAMPTDPPVPPPTAKPPVASATALRPLVLVPHRLTAAERHRRICDLAYRRAELRRFAPGGEIDDWLEAEREVDAGRF